MFERLAESSGGYYHSCAKRVSALVPNASLVEHRLINHCICSSPLPVIRRISSLLLLCVMTSRHRQSHLVSVTASSFIRTRSLILGYIARVPFSLADSGVFTGVPLESGRTFQQVLSPDDPVHVAASPAAVLRQTIQPSCTHRSYRRREPAQENDEFYGVNMRSFELSPHKKKQITNESKSIHVLVRECVVFVVKNHSATRLICTCPQNSYVTKLQFLPPMSRL